MARALLVAHASTAAARASAVSIAMADLQAELKCRRLGEDGYVTIVRHHERHCNLEGDYGTPVVAPVAHATHTPSCPGVTGGCVALAPHVYMVV
jgi:hypothetical protein